MPHSCTTCGRTFADGSKEMLAGCPDCGGNKFQFLPEGAAAAGAPGEADRSPTERRGEDIIEAPGEEPPVAEDRAQASARRAVVRADELPPRPEPPEEPEPAKATESGTPDLEALREELNQQFESIKILQPGEYELNLMELYDREEYIVALEEDGRYVIDVPSTWQGGPDPVDDR